MKLKKIELVGFKNLVNHTFTFAELNLIQGDRSRGKTALLEAIVWCLGGCDLNGNTRNVTKRYKNADTKVMTVTTYWVQCAGQSSEEVISRSVSRSTTIRRNGHIVTQESIEELFGALDTFLSVFIPGYLSGLPAAKFSSVILSMLPSPVADMPALSEKLHDLTVELTETEEYIQDNNLRLKKAKLNQSLSKNDKVLLEQLHAHEEKLKDLRSSESLEEPAYIQEMLDEQKALGKRYHDLVAEWKELSKKSGSVQKLEEIRKECQSALDRGFVLKKEITSSTKQYHEELEQFQRELQAEEQSLLLEIQTIKSQLELKSKYGSSNQLAMIQKNISDAEEERSAVMLEIQSLKEQAVKYAQHQVDAANQHLRDCSVQMVKRESQGQIVFKYELLYKGVSFYSLSMSEKAICSLELSELLLHIKSISIPVFIDGLDGVESNVQTQLFLTRVTGHDTLIVA